MVLVGLACRVLIFSTSIAAVAVIGLLVLHQAPIYWWMSTAKAPSLEFASAYSPVESVQPLLGRAKRVRPSAAPSAGACNVLLSQHAHTTHSDGSMTVKQVLDWHKAHGYTAVAITDHNSWAGGLEAVSAKKDAGSPAVLAGMEWSHCRGHFNFLLPSAAAASLDWDRASSTWRPRADGAGPATAPALATRAGRRLPWEGSDLEVSNDALAIPLRKYPSDEEMRQAFAAVHALGGIVVANHLPWSAWSLERSRLPSRDNLVEWGADYVELAHEMTLDAQSLPYVQGRRLGPIAGTDLHVPEQHAYGWTCLNVTDPQDEEAIFAALRQPASVDVLFNAEGSPELLKGQPEDTVSSWPLAGQLFAPLRWVGELFQTFMGTSSGPAYSFVDGYCGEPRRHWLRWRCIFAAVFWLALLFAAHHVLLCLWARCRGKDLDSVI
mmetsp:Transcript_76379/g.210922  ORF Transcript_76379/g.210922 Transcript_76379/m.210922 type:complete len:437 (+) Transcript_76379:138-1448(+)